MNNQDIKLKELLETTDALTYINALQITLKELKAQFSEIEEMAGFTQNHCDKAKKLIRRADHQYRLISKLVQNTDALATSDTVEDNIEIQEIMEEE